MRTEHGEIQRESVSRPPGPRLRCPPRRAAPSPRSCACSGPPATPPCAGSLARQPAAPPAATPVAKVGTVGGKRPAIKETLKTFDDCNAAVAWINSGTYTGEAQPVYAPTAGKIRGKKLPDGTEQAEVDLTWAYDASSTAEVIVPSGRT